MEKQSWEESERRREEERRSEKRKSEKKEDAGAQKGRKVAILCVLPMICGTATQAWIILASSNVVSCGRCKGFCELSRVKKNREGSGAALTTTTTTLHYTALHYSYTTLHYTTATLHYTTLQQLHYTTVDCTALHDAPRHRTTLRYTIYNYSYNYTHASLHYTRLHYTTPHFST